MSIYLSPQELTLTVTDPQIGNGVVRYKVSICHPHRPSITLSYVYRRFSEFETVFKKLHGLNPSPPLPPIPEKRWLGNTEPAFVELRKAQLEFFLKSIVANRLLVQDVDFLRLVGYPPPEMQMPHANAFDANTHLHTPTKATYADPTSKNKPKATTTVSTVITTADRSIAQYPTSPAIDDFSVWLRYGDSTPHDTNIQAANGWVRSSPYRIVKPLQHIAYRSLRKTFLLLADAQKNPCVLSVYELGPKLAQKFCDEKQMQHLTRLLTSLSSELIGRPQSVMREGGHIFIVNPLAKYGSVRDRIFGVSEKHILEDKSQKYSKKGAPLKTEEIQLVGRQLLLAIQQCHEFNVPCSQLHLGNVVVDSISMSGCIQKVRLIDFESTVLGCTTMPVVLPFNDSPVDEVTHLDVLKFGLCLLEMSLGMVLTPEREARLLTVFGPSWMPSWTKSDEPRQEDPLADLPAKVPTSVSEIVKYIFGRSEKATVETLLGHSFFNRGPCLNLHPNGVESLKLKRKDLVLISDVASRWSDLMNTYEENIKREEEGRAAVHDLKKKRKGNSVETVLPTIDTKPPVVSPPPNVKAPPQNLPPPMPPQVEQAKAVGLPPAKKIPPPPPPEHLVPKPAVVRPPTPTPAKTTEPPPQMPQPKAPDAVPPSGGGKKKVPTSTKKVPPPPSGDGPPPTTDARAALLADIRRGTRLTQRGD